MSRRPKYAQSVDGNQKEIIDALEKIGCTVVAIGTPVDILVGYRARNFLIEIKDPDSSYGKKDQGTKAQRDFFATWQGQVRVCRSAEEAIRLVTRAYMHHL